MSPCPSQRAPAPPEAPLSSPRRPPPARPPRWPLLVLLLALAGAACVPEQPVAVRREVVHLRGDPYQRGLQHGTLLRHRVRAFYTQVLVNALLPNLNREQPPIAGFLVHYAGPQYQDGRFSYELLLEMARSVEPTLPAAVRDELRGIADGAGLSYDEVLVLNTFADTVLAVRAIAATLKLSHGPRLTSVQLLGALTATGSQQPPLPYVALPHALTTAVPLQAPLRLVYEDEEGVAVETLRLVTAARTYGASDAEVAVEVLARTPADRPARVAFTLTPPGGWPPATSVGVALSVADVVVADDPLPAHLRFGREEGFTFTTAGDPRLAEEVANVAPDDGRSRPPPVIAAVRGAASAGGDTLLGQHFALLDAGAAHEATVVLVHHPDQGPAYATVGWAGMAWGFSGLSAAGLAVACNFSDTLDNAITKDLLPRMKDLPTARITAAGWPIGFALRAVLAADTTVAAARARLATLPPIMGWTCALADGQGGLEAVELDADARLFGGGDPVVLHPVPPADDPDLLALSVHYLANVADVDPAIRALAGALLADAGLNVRISDQAEVSSYWLKSIRARHRLLAALAAQRGAWEVPRLQGLLTEPAFVDRSDSMNAVVLDPAGRVLHHAMGAVPATDASWQQLRLEPSP